MVDLLLEARASTKMVTHDTQTSCLHMAAKNNAVNHARLNSKGFLYLLIPVLCYFRLLSIVACRCRFYVRTAALTCFCAAVSLSGLSRQVEKTRPGQGGTEWS